MLLPPVIRSDQCCRTRYYLVSASVGTISNVLVTSFSEGHGVREQSCAHVNLGLTFWRICLSCNGVNIHERKLFFQTSKACSPQVESGPWLVHKRALRRDGGFSSQKDVLNTSPRIVQMGFCANNVCVQFACYMLSFPCPQCCTLRNKPAKLFWFICKMCGAFPVRIGTVSRGDSILVIL